MKPYYSTECGDIYQGDSKQVLSCLPEKSVHCCVTSVPYWGLRDYGTPPLIWDGDPNCQHVWGLTLPEHHKGQVPDSKAVHTENAIGQNTGGGQFCQKCDAWLGSYGLEPTPELYVKHTVDIFREVKRVLRDDGTLWLNLGDSYARSPGRGVKFQSGDTTYLTNRQAEEKNRGPEVPQGLKEKDIVGIPWLVAFALRADGWYLRQDIIWAKKNCMPESVTDRCTKSHEYIFLLSKSARYYYDADAVREPLAESTIADKRNGTGRHTQGKNYSKHFNEQTPDKTKGDKPSWYRGKTFVNQEKGRNKRSVWNIATKPFKAAHFATFPPALIEPCILAGCPKGGTVLDPFFGSGTTGVVAYKHDRRFVGIELSKVYLDDIVVPRIEAETKQMKLFRVAT